MAKEQRKPIAAYAATLSDLRTKRGKGIDELGVLCIADFFLIQSPRIREGSKKSSVQTRILKNEGLNGSDVKKLIESVLFDGNVDYCLEAKKFRGLAKRRGLFLDERIKNAPISALLLVNCRTEHQSGIERIAEGETRADCFFRHIRNAIAHGAIYKLNNGKCLFVDRSDGNKGSVGAYIITTIGRLEKLRVELSVGGGQ